MKYLLMYLFGVCNGVQLQANMKNHFYWLAVGIKHFIISTQTDKKEKDSVKDIFHVIQSLLVSIILENIFL